MQLKGSDARRGESSAEHSFPTLEGVRVFVRVRARRGESSAELSFPQLLYSTRTRTGTVQ